jgi:hypothetical protein
MSAYRLFFVVALLIAIAFAAPAPARRSTIQKRSFKVPRQLNKAHPTGPNGMAAMRKVFRKYNLKPRQESASPEGLIDQKKQGSKNGSGSAAPAAPAAAAEKNQSGTVMATPEQNAALFLSPVDIGGQTLNLDFDSGSSDL